MSMLSISPPVRPVSKATKKVITMKASTRPPTRRKTGEYVVKDWLVLDAIQATIWSAPISILGSNFKENKGDHKKKANGAKYAYYILSTYCDHPGPCYSVHDHTVLRMKAYNASITYPTKKLATKDTSGKKRRSEKVIYHCVFRHHRRRSLGTAFSSLFYQVPQANTVLKVSVSRRKGKKRSVLRPRTLSAQSLYHWSLLSLGLLWILSTSKKRFEK